MTMWRRAVAQGLLAVLGLGSVAAMDILGVLPRAGQHVCVAALVLLLGGTVRGPVAWRGRLLRILVAVVVMLVTLPVVDVALRPLLGNSLAYRPEVTFLRKWPLLPRLYSYVPNVNFEGTVYGDLAAVTGRPEHREPRIVRFRTDARGFRNEPGNVDEQIDIVLLGDSFTAGAGVSQAEMFASLVAQRTGLTVRNLSMSPVGPWGEYVYLRSEIDQLRLSERGKIVWMLYTGNDILDVYGPVGDDNIPWATPGDATAAAVFNLQRRSPIGTSLRHWTESLAAERDKVSVVNDPSSGTPVLFFTANRLITNRSREEILRHENYTSFVHVVAAVQELAAKQKLPVHVCILPTKEEMYGWMLDGKRPWSAMTPRSGFSIVTEELAGIAGMTFHDAQTELIAIAEREYAAGNLLWWRDDTHLNPQGHAAVAEVVVRSLHLSPP